jgi:hypothetical protein
MIQEKSSQVNEKNHFSCKETCSSKFKHRAVNLAKSISSGYNILSNRMAAEVLRVERQSTRFVTDCAKENGALFSFLVARVIHMSSLWWREIHRGIGPIS